MSASIIAMSSSKPLLNDAGFGRIVVLGISGASRTNGIHVCMPALVTYRRGTAVPPRRFQARAGCRQVFGEELFGHLQDARFPRVFIFSTPLKWQHDSDAIKTLSVLYYLEQMSGICRMLARGPT